MAEKEVNAGDFGNVAKDFGTTDVGAFNKAANWHDLYYGAIGYRIVKLRQDLKDATNIAGIRHGRLQEIATTLGVDNPDDFGAILAAIQDLIAHRGSVAATPHQLASERAINALEDAFNTK